MSWSRSGLIPKTSKFRLVHAFWLLQYVLHGLPGKVRNQDILQMDEKHQNPRGSGTFTDQPQCDQSFQTKEVHQTRPVPPGPDGDVLLKNKPKMKEQKPGQTQIPSSYQCCPQKWTSSFNQRSHNEDKNAEVFSNQPKKPPQTSRNQKSPNDTSPSQSLKLDLNEDRFRDGSVPEHLLVKDQTEGRGDRDDRSPSVLVQTFTDRIILEELLRRFLRDNFADEIFQTFPEVSEALHWQVSGLEEPRGGSLKEPTPDCSEHPTPDASTESTNEGRVDVPPQNVQEHPKDSTKSMMMRTGSDVQPVESRRSAETEHLDDFIVVDLYCAERVQTGSSELRGTTTVQQQEDVHQSPTGNPKADANSQSSKVRRGEMKVTAVPDWSSGGGATDEESTGLSGLTDSCEEADEEAATPQGHGPAPEVETEKVLLRTRDKPRGNCRIC